MDKKRTRTSEQPSCLSPFYLDITADLASCRSAPPAPSYREGSSPLSQEEKDLSPPPSAALPPPPSTFHLSSSPAIATPSDVAAVTGPSPRKLSRSLEEDRHVPATPATTDTKPAFKRRKGSSGEGVVTPGGGHGATGSVGAASSESGAATAALTVSGTPWKSLRTMGLDEATDVCAL